jgi:hypothetical protein
MSEEDDDNERVIFGLNPEKMTEILAEASTKDRTVVEFRRNENKDGEKVLDTALEITEHVEKLEENQ